MAALVEDGSTVVQAPLRCDRHHKMNTQPNLEIHTEIREDGACPALRPWADLPFLDQHLFQVGATRNNGGYSGGSYAAAVDHVAGLKHSATFYQVGNANVADSTAVRQY